MANYVLKVFRSYNWVSTEIAWLECRKSRDLSVTSDAETVGVGC